MKANNIPTREQLRLGPGTDEDTPDEALMSAVGDPAYLHELGDGVSRWSRKQIEKALGRLLRDRRIVQYGTGTRRLYATPRPIDRHILMTSAKHVRLLQYMPVTGEVEHASITRLMSETRPVVESFMRLGFLVVTKRAGGRQIISLTDRGREARIDLGTGLALPALTPADARRPDPATMEDPQQETKMPEEQDAAPATADRVKQAVLDRMPIPRPDDAAARGEIRAAFAEIVTGAIRSAAGVSGMEIKVVGAMAGVILDEDGVTTGGGWFADAVEGRRLPDRAESEAIARVFGVDAEEIGPHVELAPWTLEEGRRGTRLSDERPMPPHSEAASGTRPEGAKRPDEAWNPMAGITVDGDPLSVVMATLGGQDVGRLLRGAHDLETAAMILRLLADRRATRPGAEVEAQ